MVESTNSVRDVGGYDANERLSINHSSIYTREAVRHAISPASLFCTGMEDGVPPVVEFSTQSVIDAVAEKDLTMDKLNQISYFQIGEVWFIRMGDLPAIRLTNESVQSTPPKSDKFSTFTSQNIARELSQKLGLKIPDRILWGKMVEWLGGYTQLQRILQMPFDGIGGTEGKGHLSDVWCAEDGRVLRLDLKKRTGRVNGHFGLRANPHDLSSVRLHIPE